ACLRGLRRRHAHAAASGPVRGLASGRQSLAAGGAAHPACGRGRAGLRERRLPGTRPAASGGDGRRRFPAGRCGRCLWGGHGQRLQPARPSARGRAGRRAVMSAWTFRREGIGRFRFVHAGYDEGSGTARLVYAFDDGPELVETIHFPDAPPPGHPGALQQALRLLHLIAGVSYYKAAIPARIAVEPGVPDADTAGLMDAVYTDGLPEFAWRNGLDLRGHVCFPRSADAGGAPASTLGLPRRSLVASGGGKDSLGTVELLRGHGEDMTLVWVGDSPLIAAVAARTGLPTL